MKYLLDNDLLTGPHEVQTRLRPWRYARLIVGQDGAFALASHLCQVWGGASNPIIPLVDHVSPIPDDIVSDLTRAEIDGYVVPAGGSDPSPPHLERAGERDFPAAIIVAQTPRSSSRTLQVVDLEDGDPWKPIYLATLGMVADRVDDALLATLNVQSFLLDDIIPVEHIRIKGSLEDLLGRLSDPETITPRQFSTLQLASGANPHTGYMGSAPLIQPAISMRHTAAGPNVAVVFTPGSVDDFALLWNLRCFWGDQRALPIGLPREEINDGTFDKIYQYAGMFGFGGGHLHLVSESLSIDDLETFRRTAPPVEVATRSELLRFGRAPSRFASQMQDWNDGKAQLLPLTEGDRQLFNDLSQLPTLRLSVRVADAPVPQVGTLRGPTWDQSFYFGNAQIRMTWMRPNNTVSAFWPSNWSSLVAASLDKDLEVRESQPGIAAKTLIAAIGDLWDVFYLCDQQLIELLYSLAERSGMSWWKERWARLEKELKAQGTTQEDIGKLAAIYARDAPAVAPSNEGRQLTYDRFKAVFGDRVATDRWLEWALTRRLVVKGVELDCPSCRARFWLPLAEVAPPHVCPGCARHINDPFDADQLKFRYRIGEVLRRCLELDALGHVVFLSWLVALFSDRGLIGAHPGVEFLKDGKVSAEVDVLLLFEDGTMAPVEVKRRAAGLNQRAIDQLEHTSTILGAQFDVVGVLDAANQCSEAATIMRSLPERPRFLVTLDHLTSKDPVWLLGESPFELDPRPTTDTDSPRRQWLSRIAQIGSGTADQTEGILGRWRRKRSSGSVI